MVDFTIGSDPEVFVSKNGKPVSAHGMIPGTKESPHKMPRGAVQVDGMALEFNTDPVPLKDGFEPFNTNVVAQLKNLRTLIPEKHNLTVAPVMEFSKKTMDDAPEKAKELGCDPDWNAYTLALNPPPDAEEVLFRTGAGHLHVGWGQGIPADNMDHVRICADFIKVLDCSVGLFMAFIDREPRRRELYGKAGAFRPKPYGVEYRTPSNAWLTTRARRACVYDALTTGIQWRRNGSVDAKTIGIAYRDEDSKVHHVTQEEVVRIINEGDHQKAKVILDYSMFGTWHKGWMTVVEEMEKLEGGN